MKANRPRSPVATLVELHNWAEIPQFSNEADEAEFWATHSLGEALLAGLEPPPPGLLPSARPRTSPVAVRCDQRTLLRLKTLARKRHKG